MTQHINGVRLLFLQWNENKKQVNLITKNDRSLATDILGGN